MPIVYARDTADLEKEIAKLYNDGLTNLEIGERVGLAGSSVGRRLGKMLRSGEILPTRGRLH